MAHTLLREEYRKKFGIGCDRRFRDWLKRPAGDPQPQPDPALQPEVRHVRAAPPSPPAPPGLNWYDPRRELPLSAWVNLLDQVASFRPQLYLTGGEPTLYPHFPAFLTAAKQRGFMVHLQTNGTLLDRVAEYLVAQGVEAVTVSMDGPQEVHDAIRGQKDAFRKTTAGMRGFGGRSGPQARRPGPIITINCVISKASLATLDQMVPLAHELGADILQIQHTIFNTATNIAAT